MEVKDIMEPKTKKNRKSYGRMSSTNKRLKLQSHEMGDDCKCTRQCFELVPQETRSKILAQFNLLKSHDDQNIYLCGLISVLPINRPSKSEAAKHHGATYKYKVRGPVAEENDNETIREFDVCRKAFMAIHGISKKKIEYLVKKLQITGCAPSDMRGKHGNHQHKLSVETVSIIRQHINSFKGRKSHYSLNDSSKTYLPEEMNITKMLQMFKCKYPDVKVSYETYRDIFSKDFNIAFGYPRTDTCGECDEYIAKRKSLEAEIKMKSSQEEIQSLSCEINKLELNNTVHKKKAEAFYSRKRRAKQKAKQSNEYEAICFDYGKNLSVPNISSNEVYYKRQLSVYAFNVHVLSNADSVFYVYPEHEGKKGSDDVCSLLHHFIYNYLSSDVKHLSLFCDSCGGQQKNFTFFRFIYNLVNVEKKLESITVTFPIRGHSYLENDKNMGLVNSKSTAIVPKDWASIIRNSRQNPSSFNVVEVDHSMFKCWTKFLDTKYVKKSPFPSRPVREITIQRGSLLRFRITYNGAWESVSITPRRNMEAASGLPEGQFQLPDYAYEGPLHISAEKYKDLQDLMKYCGGMEKEYFLSLPHH
ncbi:hypothetical protein C0J52_11211 [Blattella germanica]|nr:hypothetical protein C0J52_11211 [Blattella germanica]